MNGGVKLWCQYLQPVYPILHNRLSNKHLQLHYWCQKMVSLRNLKNFTPIPKSSIV